MYNCTDISFTSRRILLLSLYTNLDFREMQLAKMLNSVIFLSILGEGVGAKKEEGSRDVRENRTDSVTLENERKEFFRDRSTEEDLVAVEDRERAERSLIGACINISNKVQYQNQYPSINIKISIVVQYQYK